MTIRVRTVVVISCFGKGTGSDSEVERIFKTVQNCCRGVGGVLSDSAGNKARVEKW